MQVTPSGSAPGWQFKRHKIDSNISVIRIEENIEQKNKKYCRNKQPTAILHNNNTANQPTQSYLTLAAFTPLHWPPSNQIFCCFDYRKNDVCVRLFGAKSNAFWEIAEKKKFPFLLNLQIFHGGTNKMADPDADTEDEFENTLDYYSVLNVRKDVS